MWIVDWSHLKTFIRTSHKGSYFESECSPGDGTAIPKRLTTDCEKIFNSLCETNYTWCVQKVSDLNFSRINKSSTGSVYHCRCGGDIYAHAWIVFPPIESASRRQSVDDCVSVVNARRIVNYCKMTERLEQRYCIKFYQKLGDTQVETIRKIQQAFGDDAMSITRIKKWYNRFKDGSTAVDVNYCKMTERLEQRYCIKFCQKLGDTQVETIRKIQQAFGDDVRSITQKSGTTASNMAAHQWTANHVTLGPQLAEMTMSSTKCGLCSCRTVVSLSENWQTRWG